MARYPGATWKPLAADWASQPRMRAHNIICIHTMVGGLDGTDALFRVNNGPGYDGTESHFGTGGDGRILEWQDITFQADANYLGNGEVISIENADYGPEFPTWTGSDVPSLTPAQIEANAQIIAWASSPAAHADCPPSWVCHQSGIPLVLVPDALPGRRGIAPHRWGVPGYMVPGAVQWSTSRGKACPGDRRIAQIPQIITRAQQIVGGSSTTLEDSMAGVSIAVGPEKTCWINDGTKVWWSSDITEVSALAKMWGVPIVPMANAEIQKVIDFVSRRKAESDAATAAAVSKVLPTPTLTGDQVKDLADKIVAKITPSVSDATPLTEDDIKRLLDDSEIDTVNLLAKRLNAAS
jgi:hypothetical protein